MIKSNISKLIITGASGITLLTFNVALANKVSQKLDKTTQIVQNYEKNEQILVDKYNSLDSDAKNKINEANKIINEKNKIISDFQKEINDLKMSTKSNPESNSKKENS